ncbi:hypothetical protein [uncultured Tenacibaculum sp.]|uniref:hypothetical protein n=1 Tax=uncultured Tenacibaculum sp. TaxID=174713 RepID=UPI00260685CC|nr:hypothetical protein [uncultured Tenacibaculum sp.]
MRNIFFILFFYCLVTFSQSINDYRAINTGNWTNIAVWEIYDGTSWISATSYPGQLTVTNDVIIGNDVTISINSNITGNINSVTVGDRAGGIDTLLITNTASLNTLQFTIAYDGLLNWNINKTFVLPANTSFGVESPNPDSSLILGVDYGIYVNPSACSASKILQIGTIKYATCNGGGGRDVIEFSEVNNKGGNLSVFPTITTPTPICSSTTIQLNANPGGTEISDTPLNYSWTVISPSGYSFSSNIENPIDTPVNPGTYTYQVVLTNASGLSSTANISVIVENCTKTIITNRGITYRVKN